MDKDPCTGAWLPLSITNTDTGNVSTELQYVFNMPVPGVPYSGRTVELNQFFSIVGQYSWIRANVSSITNGIVDLIKIAF